ncbi:MAG: hypothetical protein LGB58_07070 [Sulfurovum sp.]|nr:hypothetical protein [Sulfurovum sp.]
MYRDAEKYLIKIINDDSGYHGNTIGEEQEDAVINAAMEQEEILKYIEEDQI